MTIVCPKCGRENQPGRKTCERCFEPLLPKAETPAGKAGASGPALPDAVGPRIAVPPVAPLQKKPETAGSLLLRCLNGDRPGVTYALDRVQMLIGRRDCLEGIYPDIDLTDQELSQPKPWMSRQHAEVTWTLEGCWVTDVGSVNKTQVNGQKLERFHPHLLHAGDKLTLGHLEFQVERVEDE